MLTTLNIPGNWIVSIMTIIILFTSPGSYAADPLQVGNVPDHGKLILQFVTPKKDVNKDIKTVFERSGVFQDIVNGMNHEFIFPKNVIVKFDAGDGPVYYPASNTIQMSYDFIFYLTVLYVERYPQASDDDMMNFALRSTTFLFYHEMAHAFIDIFQLPIVGNEETAADNLAVILALEYSNDGFNIVMDSAELFDLLESDNHKKYQDDDYWDEHTLDAQRFYNILCLAYGKEPKNVMQRVKEVGNKNLYQFIKEKGDYCTDEYQRQLQGWGRLLSQHFTQE